MPWLYVISLCVSTLNNSYQSEAALKYKKKSAFRDLVHAKEGPPQTDV